MKGIVAEGEELMLHRLSTLSTSGGNNHPEMPARSTPGGNQAPMTPANSMSGGNNEPEMPAHTTPIRKFCRNRGQVTQARQDETTSLDALEVMVMQDKHTTLQDKLSVTGVMVIEDMEMVKDRQEVLQTSEFNKPKRLFEGIDLVNWARTGKRSFRPTSTDASSRIST
jgi:hypothetical protein